MQISVFAIGRKMPDWVEKASRDYVKRLPGRWKFTVREFTQAQGPNRDVVMAKEATMLLDAIPEKTHVIALDNRGTSWSTEQLAGQLRGWQEIGKNIVLIIGGAEGLHSRVRERADQQWCLSPLTFPHPLVRVILIEQLYRGQSLLDNHPYHRA
ncbi:MAG: 23S rRNA (pseudouridine(1915)-N(3))-methyltransferase RlmH [Granulosicoccus sp.]